MRTLQLWNRIGAGAGAHGGRSTDRIAIACRLKLACRIMRSSSTSPGFPDFAPRFPWWGPDLQTLRNVVRGAVRKPHLEEEPARLLLPMRDGSGDQLVGQYLAAQQRSSSRNEAPLVVLVHGLGGSSDSAYIQTTSAHLLELGYPVLQLNLRGAGESRPLCREQYHAGRSRDLHDALGGLPPDSVRNGIVVVGYSLGANMVLKYAAEHGAEHGGLRAAISISAPIDLEASSLRFLDARNRFYHTHLLDGMKKEMLSTPGGVGAEEQRTLNGIRTISRVRRARRRSAEWLYQLRRTTTIKITRGNSSARSKFRRSSCMHSMIRGFLRPCTPTTHGQRHRSSKRCCLEAAATSAFMRKESACRGTIDVSESSSIEFERHT